VRLDGLLEELEPSVKVARSSQLGQIHRRQRAFTCIVTRVDQLFDTCTILLMLLLKFRDWTNPRIAIRCSFCYVLTTTGVFLECGFSPLLRFRRLHMMNTDHTPYSTRPVSSKRNEKTFSPQEDHSL